jgi:hypothetical protein
MEQEGPDISLALSQLAIVGDSRRRVPVSTFGNHCPAIAMAKPVAAVASTGSITSLPLLSCPKMNSA